MVFVFIEILFKMLLFKGGVLIYTEHCIYIYTVCIYIYIYIYTQGLELTFLRTSQFGCYIFKLPAIHNSTSQKTKTEIHQQLEAVYTGREKATFANNFVSVIRVCDIDKNNVKKLLNIFWDFFDKDNKTIFC